MVRVSKVGRIFLVAGAGLAIGLLATAASPPKSKARPPAAARAPAPEIAPCEAIAAQARRLGDARWSAEGTSALESLVDITPAAAPTSMPEAQVAIQAQVRRAVDLPDGRTPVEVRRLPGTEVFEVSHVSGTAACQSLAFARAAPGAPAVLVPSPSLDGELCGASHAHVGRAGGVPALIHLQRSGLSPGEANAARKPLATIRVTPWTGQGWGRTCKVEFLMNAERRMAERLCARPEYCKAFETTAQVLAAAFNRTKAQDALYQRQASPVRYDLDPPPKSTEPLVAQVRAQLQRTQRDLPVFGKTPKTQVMPAFSEDELDVVATQYDGRWHVAAIGFPGIGWRQDRSVTLVTVYEAGKAAVPRATYIFQDGVSGLELAKASLAGE